MPFSSNFIAKRVTVASSFGLLLQFVDQSEGLRLQEKEFGIATQAFGQIDLCGFGEKAAGVSRAQIFVAALDERHINQ